MESFESIKELLHNSSTYYLITVKMDSCYGYVNQQYQKLFDGKFGDLHGQHYSITMHPNDTEICAKVSALCFLYPDKTFPATIRKHDGKGGYIATKWDYKAMFDQNGNPTGIICIGYDITSFIAKTAALEEMEFIQSHIIRKPIANLIGLVSLLNEKSISDDINQILEMVKGSISELDNITNSNSIFK
jgi:hypothetical protein